MKKQKGQVAIMVLLASAVLLTLGLSASKRTITNVKVDTDEELLKQAFSTAESGINNYLSNSSLGYSGNDNSVAVVTKSDIGNTNILSSDGVVLPGQSQFFWLVNHEADGTIGSSYYSSSRVGVSMDGAFNGALKVDYFYKSGANYLVSRSGYNFNSITTVNGYSASANAFNYNLLGSPVLLVLTPVGTSSRIMVTSSAANVYFPVQGEDLTSVGTVDGRITTQVRTKNVYQIPQFLIDSITARDTIQ